MGSLKNRHSGIQPAFTLVELLVVISIIGLLVALLLPTLSQARTATRDVGCMTTLRTMIQATHAYATDCNGLLPAGVPSPFYGPQASGGGYMTTRPSRGGPYYLGPTTAPRMAHVAYLMNSGHLPETKDAWTCPQASYREDRGYNNPTPGLLKSISPGPGTIEDTSYRKGMDRLDAQYYKTLAVTGSTNHLSTYNIRGTPNAMRISDLQKWDIAGLAAAYPKITVQDSKYAFYFDREQATSTISTLYPRVNNQVSPLPGWGRVHIKGINTAYMDGHAETYADERRNVTYWGGNFNVPSYGNAERSDCYDKQ